MSAQKLQSHLMSAPPQALRSAVLLASHAQQRSNHATGGHFEKASKRLTKMRFAE